jgi:hypothetical protein
LHIEKDGVGPIVTLTGKTDANADATLLLSRAGATAVQGLKFRYDAATADGYIDNLYNNNNGDIFIRTKTAGTPIVAVTVAGSGKVTLADTMVAAGIRSEGPSRLKGEVTAGATATPVVISTTGDVTANGKVVARDSVTIGRATTTDNIVPYFRLKGDADSDASAVTSDQLTVTLTPNATPTSATWAVTSTQASAGFTFNKKITGTSTGTALEGCVSNSSTTGMQNAMILHVKTSGTSVDGYGARQMYQLTDDSGNDQNIGGVAVVRDGADQYGAMHLITSGADGSLKNRVTIKATGATGFFTETPGASLELRGAAIGSVSADTIFSAFNDRYGAAPRDSSFNVLSNGNLGINGAVQLVRVVSLTDGAQYLLPTGVTGFGQVKATGAWCFFHFAADGTVTLEDHVSGSTTENNDTTLNVFDGGSGIGIENELGSTLNVLIDITYYTP